MPTPSAEAEQDDDSDYDPFTEEPAPHVAEQNLRRSPLGDQRVLEELQDLVKKAQEESMHSLAHIQVVNAHIAAAGLLPPLNGNLAMSDGSKVTRALEALVPTSPIEQNVKLESSVPSEAPADSVTQSVPAIATVNRRMRTGAKLAQEYFVHAGKEPETPPKKRQRAEPTHFAKELLAKAPSSLQTCRSLLLFLNKKLESPAQAMPAVEGPEDLCKRLESYADTAGRLAGLRQPNGWDARAKRVLDISSHAASSAAQAALGGAESELDGERAKLETELKVRGGGRTLDSLAEERLSWARDRVRWEWLSWCAQLLHAQEALLLAQAEKKSSCPGRTDSGEEVSAIGTAGIFEALLTGKGCRSPSRAGG